MKWEDVVVVVGLALFILLGLFFLKLGFWNVWHGMASVKWPTAPGKVVESESDSQTSSSQEGTSTMYSAKIAIQYRVDGHDYTTEILKFGQTEGSGDSSEAQLRRLRYPIGAKVSVSYQPGNPSRAAAEPGVSLDSLLLPAAGLGFLLPGIMFLFLYFSTRSASLANIGFKSGLGLFALIFVLIGIAMLLPALINLWRAHASARWPTTTGVIVYGQTDSSTSITRDDEDRTSSSTSHGTHLAYRYEVRGFAHFSNVRRFGQIAAAGSEWAQQIAETYPLGKKVKVFYDPAQPDVATLETGITSESFWLPGAGAAFLLFGAAVFIWGIPALTRDF